MNSVPAVTDSIELLGILFLFDIGIGDGYSPCAFFSWSWSAQEDIATGAWSGYFKEHSRGMDVNQEIWI